MSQLQSLIFDVDGTLADTEMVHMAAFNQAFAEEGLDWHWDVPLYTELLRISGGKERMRHFWMQRHPDIKVIDGGALNDTIDRLHTIKTAAYEAAVQQGLVQLRPGVLNLIETAHAEGLKLAIATTTSPVNIAVLLRGAMGPNWKDWFMVIEDASTAPKKKPHPQVYTQTLTRLGLPANACLAFEDSHNGLQAAMGAGLATIITPTHFTSDHDFKGAAQLLPNLDGVGLPQLRAWHAQMQT